MTYDNETPELDPADPPEFEGTLLLLRGIVALTSSALAAVGHELESRNMQRCAIRLPGPPLCTIRSFQTMDMAIMIAWGATGFLSASPLLFVREMVALCQAALLAHLSDTKPEDLGHHLMGLLLRAQDLRMRIQQRTGR